ncbi:MAG: hypothetical protein WCZ66_09970 [Sphingomonadaceae bacterium]
MPAEHSHDEQREGTCKLEGYTVEIRILDGKEQLWIDGMRRKFFVTQDGYTLHADAFAPPQKTLLGAVKQYLEKKPELGHEH